MGVKVTVQPGETLASIAAEFRVTESNIINDNKGRTLAGRKLSANNIRPGDQFYVQQRSFHDSTGHGNKDNSDLWGDRGEKLRLEREKAIQDRLRRDQARQAQDAGSTNSPRCVAGQPNCIKEYVDIVHVNLTDEKGKIVHKFLPLTADERKLCENEENLVKERIANYCQKIAQIPANTPQEEVTRIKQQLFTEFNTISDAHGNLFGGNQVTVKQSTYSNESPSKAETVTITDPRDMNRIIEARRFGRHPQSNRYYYVRAASIDNILARTVNYVVPSRSLAQRIFLNELSGELNQEQLTAVLEDRASNENSKGFFKPEFKAALRGNHTFYRQSVHEWNYDDTWQKGGFKIDVANECQVFRFASNATGEDYSWYTLDGNAEGTFSSKEIAVSIRAQFESSLLKGSRKLTLAFPQDKDGWHLAPKYKDVDGVEHQVNLGYMRAAFSFIMSGFAGVSALLGAEMKVDLEGGTPSFRSTVASRNIDDNPGVRVSAFAGIKAGLGLEGSLDWVDTLVTRSSTKWIQLVKVGAEVTGSAGIGGEAQLKINFANGRFFFVTAAELVFGVGASGKVAGEVDLNQIGTMIHFMYNALLQVDFHKIAIFDGNAYDWFCKSVLYAAAMGVHGHRAVVDALTDAMVVSTDFTRIVLGELASFFGSRERQAIENLAKWIIKDAAAGENGILLFSPPEAKGRMLYQLVGKISWPSGTMQEAVAKLLECSQGARDFNLTVICMNENGTLADDDKRQDIWNKNIVEIGDYLSGSRYTHMNIDHNKIAQNNKRFRNLVDNAQKNTVNTNGELANTPIAAGRLIANNEMKQVIYNVPKANV